MGSGLNAGNIGAEIDVIKPALPAQTLAPIAIHFAFGISRSFITLLIIFCLCEVYTPQEFPIALAINRQTSTTGVEFVDPSLSRTLTRIRVAYCGMKNLRKKIRRLEKRLQEGQKKLAKLRQKLQAAQGAKAVKAARKPAARATAARPAPKPSTPIEKKSPTQMTESKKPSASKKA